MKTSGKVRVFNFFRNIFRIRFIESILVLGTRGKSPRHWVCKLVPNPYQYPRPAMRTLKRNGIIMNVDIHDYIGHYLYFGFEDKGTQELFSLCAGNFTVLDIGSNIGWTVLNLARIANQGTVLGFEPDAYNFERCNENMALNDFKNVRVFPVGAGQTNESVHMELRTPSNRGGNRVAPEGRPSASEITVVRLDDFIPVQKLSRIDLIKIDVEGFELKTLRGADRLLRKHKPVLFIELDDNNLKDQKDSALGLINFLFELGYREIRHAEDHTRILATTDFSNCHFDIIVN